MSSGACIWNTTTLCSIWITIATSLTYRIDKNLCRGIADNWRGIIPIIHIDSDIICSRPVSRIVIKCFQCIVLHWRKIWYRSWIMLDFSAAIYSKNSWITTLCWSYIIWIALICTLVNEEKAESVRKQSSSSHWWSDFEGKWITSTFISKAMTSIYECIEWDEKLFNIADKCEKSYEK